MTDIPVRATDAWAQPVSAGLQDRLPEISRLFEKSGSAQLLGRGLDPAEIVALMDAAGIHRLMLAAWCRPSGWVITHDEISRHVEAFPDRFVGVATVDLADPVKAVRELDECVRGRGFKALRIVPWLWRLPPNDKLYYPLYVKCIELGIPFCTQVGHTGPAMPSEPGRPIPYVDEVALTFPDLVIVCGHIGHPWTDEMIGLSWKHDNVYIDTSAYLPRYYPPQLLQFMSTYGKRKVLFGSNFPQLPFDRCMIEIEKLNLAPDVKALFLRENAMRVFKLP